MAIFCASTSFPPLLLVFLFLAYSSTSTMDLNTDALSLLAFKSLLRSESSSLNWSDNTTLVCSWTGVTCDSIHRRVVGLDLSDMGLQGSLPAEMGNLTFLISLDISGNHFSGNLPQELSQMRRLRFMDMGGNDLSGQIPLGIGFLNELRMFHLDNNSFSGLLPYSIGNASKLERLKLQYNKIEGAIPTSVFNLSKLAILDLGSNKFVGTLPSPLCSGIPEITSLLLQDNELEGELPSNISACTQLQVISMSNNKLSGSIPSDMSSPLSQLQAIFLDFNSLVGDLPKTLGEWKALELFNIKENHITGIIPPGVSNLTNLQQMTLSRNKISGTIPDELGLLGKLDLFAANHNLLRGIPYGIFNISSLQVLSITDNKLSGKLPDNFCFRLHNLVILHLGLTELFGQFPPSISNCSSLETLDVPFNHFGGIIPTSIGELRFLKTLSLQVNNFSSESSTLGFIDALANCRYLNTLTLSFNPLIAALPNTVGNLSTSLWEFDFFGCGLYGTIPTELGNLTSLILLRLENNSLIGSIPTTLGNLQHMQKLMLNGNKLSGFIPDVLCNLQSTNYIYLLDNDIGGGIPTCIGNITALSTLCLSNNKLESTIPSSLWQLNYILELNLSSNLLNGSISSDIGNLKVAYLVDISNNDFTGVIPTSIGGMQSLTDLSLAHNKFKGSIPESFGTMLSLKRVNLSHNSLSGEIPKALHEISTLVVFDVSFNNLSGGIPIEGSFRNFSYEFFESNEGLCGDSKFHVPPCKFLKDGSHRRKLILLVILALSIGFGLSIAFFLVYMRVKGFRRKQALPVEAAQPLSAFPIRISYHTILKATDNLNHAYLLGNGAFGAVYKGVVSDGKTIAIKVFDSQNERVLKSFDVECNVLRRLRHRNLCKVISVCSNEDIKALVMEYLPNGNLHSCLHGENNFLNIMQRLSVMIDIACALEYLHYGYITPIVHCDLKPSNILLDEDMVAYLSDFGISKFLGDMDTFVHTSTLATIGYIAPEYGSEGLVSTMCDVYSYGILLMEVFTGKKPSDDEFSGDLTLRGLVQNSMFSGLTQVIDPRLFSIHDVDFTITLECLSSTMSLALKCSMENPNERISMKDVVVTLRNISSKLSRNLGRFKEA